MHGQLLRRVLSSFLLPETKGSWSVVVRRSNGNTAQETGIGGGCLELPLRRSNWEGRPGWVDNAFSTVAWCQDQLPFLGLFIQSVLPHRQPNRKPDDDS